MNNFGHSGSGRDNYYSFVFMPGYSSHQDIKSIFLPLEFGLVLRIAFSIILSSVNGQL